MQRIHFIAIGGAIMHQLAIALHRKGNTVTGSDDAIADPAKGNLEHEGILPEIIGWHPQKISGGLDAVVLGMHAKEDNPELKAALAAGIPVFSFPQYVYELSKEKQRIVVAGSHGKTTITSMIMHVLQAAGKDFDYLVGAKVQGFESSVKLSDAPIIILEGDEYPASAVEKRPKIFFYHPHISVLSGIAWDHINVFPTIENYLSQFRTYIEGIEPGGLLIYNDEDSEVKLVAEQQGAHLKKQAYCTPKYKHESGAAILETAGGPVPVSVFGWHNLLNIEAARGVCNALGITDEVFYPAISTFTGAARRLERVSEHDGLIVFRDFAHAPSKLKATLSAVRQALPQHYLIAVFELHTFSSLDAGFIDQYRDSMDGADAAVVSFSKEALAHKGLAALSPDAVAASFSHGKITVTDNKEALVAQVRDALRNAPKPACLLLMSSGTFDGIMWEDVAREAGSAGKTDQ